MTDLEIVKLCALAAGYKNPTALAQFPGCTIGERHAVWVDTVVGGQRLYDPLHDDRQCLELVKQFHLAIEHNGGSGSTAVPAGWYVMPSHTSDPDVFIEGAQDLNRAICSCVAQMQAAKTAQPSPAPQQ